MALDDNPAFREWVDKQPDPLWPQLPLTHITRGICAERIARAGQVELSDCPILGRRTAYLFYGRAAYRPTDADVVKLEAACPFCFVFDEIALGRADAIHAFDTGAFAKDRYGHVLTKDMRLQDFSLGRDLSRPNKLIARVFGSQEAYFHADRTKITTDSALPWEMHARAYVELLKSPGNNDADDRVCSIEVAVHEPVPLRGILKAVVVPHTVWNERGRAPWLEMIESDGALIAPYEFIPGRHPEHYQTLLETTVRDLFREWDLPV